MYQWHYYGAGHPQYVSVAIGGYQNGIPYYLVAGQPLWSFLPSTSNPGAPAFNAPWYQQSLEVHSYAPVASSSPWQTTRAIPAVNPSLCQPQNHRPQYESPRFSGQAPLPNVQLSDQFPDPNVIRGPPRKPRQSGYALWVGNLPLNTQLQELIDFFAMDGIESIFLIRKSNCAFVNYHTQKTCQEAFTTFHLKGSAILSA
jgi:hypothetical protein